MSYMKQIIIRGYLGHVQKFPIKIGYLGVTHHTATVVTSQIGCTTTVVTSQIGCTTIVVTSQIGCTTTTVVTNQ